MRIIGKRKIGLLIILILILTAASVWATGSKRRVYDFANLLNAEEIEQLEEKAEKYSKKRETDFIILTTNNTNGKDIVEYMQDFYDHEALGFDRAHGNTAIITIDMEHREVYLAGFSKGEEYLDDYRLDLIRDKISPNLSSGDYYGGFNKFLKLGYKYMGMNPNVDPNNILFNIWFQIIVSLGIAGIIVGGMAYNSGGKVTVSQGTYMDFKNSKVVNRRDNYLRTSVTKTRRPSSNNNSSGGGFGGGGGGGGTTSGGHSHSGSRGSF